MTDMTLRRYLTRSASDPNLIFLLENIAPTGPHQQVPDILGSRSEVERLITYHSTECATAQ